MAYKIIVADPSPSVQKAVQMALAEPEFRLYPFEDGQELLNAIAEIRPDAVLLSPYLSGRDGGDVGRLLRLREEFVRVPVILLKGTFESLDIGRVAASDYDEIVQKPFDSERLAAAVRELIEKKTCPSTFPEDPELARATRPIDGPAPEASPGSPAIVPEDPASLSAGLSGPGPSGLREWVKKEIVGAEREIEKRVRARVMADLKEWVAAESKGSKGTS